MVYVIAGNREQFLEWAAEHEHPPRSAVYVDGPERLKGVRLMPGDCWVATGKPYEHPQAEAIWTAKHVAEFGSPPL